MLAPGPIKGKAVISATPWGREGPHSVWEIVGFATFWQRPSALDRERCAEATCWLGGRATEEEGKK